MFFEKKRQLTKDNCVLLRLLQEVSSKCKTCIEGEDVGKALRLEKKGLSS